MSQKPVTVLLFSSLRELVGQDTISFELAGPGMPASAVLDSLCERYPEIRAYRKFIRLAVNDCYVEGHAGVEPGDELALITPVSGG